MESKIMLYNSNNVKIGETFAREAREIVNRQRAEWIDNNHSAIRFYSGMEYMENINNTNNNDSNIVDKTYDLNEPNKNYKNDDNEDDELLIHHIYFARWTDGKYYPAIITDIIASHAKVAYLDGDTGMVSLEQIINLYEGFDTLTLQGNWKSWGYYNGVLTSTEPLIMEYDDGEVEQIHLKQLRGIRR